jgi:hypothetical protein
VTEAIPEKIEPNPEMMQSIGEHQEVPKEEAALRSSGARSSNCNRSANKFNRPIQNPLYSSRNPRHVTVLSIFGITI